MVFPRTPLPFGVELYYDGVWNDITADVSDDGVDIQRGRSSEGERVDPSSAKLTLKNTTGKYSPRNPSSPLYGKISRNTPVRVWVKHGQVRSLQPSTGSAQWQTADKAALDITGDIDLRVDIAPRTWAPVASQWFGLLKGGTYGLFLAPDGTIGLNWYQGGVAHYVYSARPVPGGFAGRKAIRVTLDVNNGSGGHTVTYYSSDTLGGTWVPFSTVVTPGSTASIDVTANALGTYTQDDCEVFGVEVRNGIGGTIVARVDFTAQTNGTTSISDGYGNTWAPLGTAECSNKHMRFWGEVVEWPQTWGLKGSPSSMSPIVCAGVLRRIRQGVTPDFSVLRRYLPTVDNLLTYWPIEDAVKAQRISAYTGTPGRVYLGTPTFAGFEGFLPSKPIMLLKTGRLTFTGKRTALYATAVTLVRWLWFNPAGGVANNTVLMRLRYASAVIEVCYGSPGGLFVKVYTSDMSTVTYTSATVGLGPTAAGIDGRLMRLGLLTKVDGSSKLEMRIEGLCADDAVGYYGPMTGLTVAPVGPLRSIDVNPNGAALDECGFGHLTTQSSDSDMFDMWPQLKSYAGEAVDDRLQRLADENYIDLRFDGAGLSVARLDVQQPDEVTALMDEAVDTDGGILFEPRTHHDLCYRTLSSIYTQTPVAKVTYSDNLLRPFLPVDDDRFTRNSVTVERRDGSSVTIDELDGPMSVFDPPDGVGAYEQSVTLSLASDEDVDDQAGWRLHMGTVDEARWPTIGLDLAHPTLLANAALTRDILALELGDRLDVVLSGLTWLPPGDVQQIVQGYTETITPFSYRLQFNCTPARPYNVAHFDELTAGTDRFDTAGSTLTAGVTSSATSLSVATGTGPLWTTDSGDFTGLRVVIGGEEMTVTAISGASSPQTFTVTRSVNGVVKAHASGADVRLARPTYYGL